MCSLALSLSLSFKSRYHFPSLPLLEMLVPFFSFDFNSQWNDFTTADFDNEKKYTNYMPKHLKAFYTVTKILWESSKANSFPTPFLFMRCSGYRFIFFSCSMLFFSTCLEMEAARALINSLKFSLVLLQSLCTPAHPSEMPFVSARRSTTPWITSDSSGPPEKGVESASPSKAPGFITLGKMVPSHWRKYSLFYTEHSGRGGLGIEFPELCFSSVAHMLAF